MIAKVEVRTIWVLVAPFFVVVLGAACSGGTPSPDSAVDAESGSKAGASGPGAECIANANGEYEKKPDEPVRIGLRHILVRHADSKRAEGETRSREQACLRALEALEKLKETEDWDAVVAEYSDEKGAATRSGSIGDLTRDSLDPNFADAAFSLEIDELSYVVESESGFHVILRTN